MPEEKYASRAEKREALIKKRREGKQATMQELKGLSLDEKVEYFKKKIKGKFTKKSKKEKPQIKEKSKSTPRAGTKRILKTKKEIREYLRRGTKTYAEWKEATSTKSSESAYRRYVEYVGNVKQSNMDKAKDIQYVEGGERIESIEVGE